jgi:DNA-binding transcriptional regulator YdaS (Cro superfamily)
MSVPNSRAILNRVRLSARRVSAKRAPISDKVGSGFVYTKQLRPAPVGCST